LHSPRLKAQTLGKRLCQRCFGGTWTSACKSLCKWRYHQNFSLFVSS